MLAELLIAGLNQVGILWRTSPALQELEELHGRLAWQLVGLPEVSAAISTTRPRPACWTPDHRALAPARPPCARVLGARPDLGRGQGRAPPRSRAPEGPHRRRVPAAAGSPRRPRRLRGHRDGRDDGHDRRGSRGRDRRALRRSGNVAARGRRLRKRRSCLPWCSAPLHRLGARRLGRVEPAQVARRPDGLLGALDPAAGRVPARFQPRAELLRSPDDAVNLRRGVDTARTPLSRAEALGRPALLRAIGLATTDSRPRPPRGALRGLGRATSRAGRSPLRGTSRSCASAWTAPMPTTSACLSA